VPQVDDEHNTVGISVIPSLVLEVVVEHEATALMPTLDSITDADRTVTVRDGDP
jgi:hypothetical protein